MKQSMEWFEKWNMISTTQHQIHRIHIHEERETVCVAHMVIIIVSPVVAAVVYDLCTQGSANVLCFVVLLSSFFFVFFVVFFPFFLFFFASAWPVACTRLCFVSCCASSLHVVMLSLVQGTLCLFVVFVFVSFSMWKNLGVKKSREKFKSIVMRATCVFEIVLC